MNRLFWSAAAFAITLWIGALACAGTRDANRAGSTGSKNENAIATGCPGDNAGLTLPIGFCATVFAEDLVHARDIVVASNGDVYVALEGTVNSPEAIATRPRGAFAALRDTNSDGHADIIHFVGDVGNTGIDIFGGYLYLDGGHEIVRYARADSQLVPGRREVVLGGVPLYPQHIARNFTIGPDTSLYVNVGSATNNCQLKDRERGSPGEYPCEELRTRAGIWRYRADRLNQVFSPAGRFATGLRNGMGMAFAADGKLYATQHGRDQLHELWPAAFPNAAYQIENPGEELMQVNQGDDFGWPYCYYAMDKRQLVDAPEYGGDGARNSRCLDKKGPIAVFPGHWAPMSLMFYSGAAFPERYRHGAFVAFHGAWNRPPRQQQGYRIIFQPLLDGAANGPFESFAVGFAGRQQQEAGEEEAVHRPVGLATSPDGALFVTDDNAGRIYRITYRGR